MNFLKPFLIQMAVLFITTPLLFASNHTTKSTEHLPRPLVYPVASLPNNFYEDYNSLAKLGQSFLVANSNRNTYLFDGFNWETINVGKIHGLVEGQRDDLFLVGQKEVTKLYTQNDGLVRIETIVDTVTTNTTGPIQTFLPLEKDQFIFTTSNGLWLYNSDIVRLDSTLKNCKLLAYESSQIVYLKEGSGAYTVNSVNAHLEFIDNTEALNVENTIGLTLYEGEPLFILSSWPYIHMPHKSKTTLRFTFNGSFRDDLEIKKVLTSPDYTLLLTEFGGFGLVNLDRQDVLWYDGQSSRLTTNEILDIVPIDQNEFLFLTNTSIIKSTNTQYAGVFPNAKGHRNNGQNILLCPNNVFISSGTSLFSMDLADFKEDIKELREIRQSAKPITGMATHNGAIYLLYDKDLFNLKDKQLSRVNTPPHMFSTESHATLTTLKNEIWLFSTTTKGLYGFCVTNTSIAPINLTFPQEFLSIQNILFYDHSILVQENSNTWWYTADFNSWETITLNPDRFEQISHISGANYPFFISRDRFHSLNLNNNSQKSILQKHASAHVIPIYLKNSQLIAKVQSENFPESYSIWNYRVSRVDSVFTPAFPIAALLSSTNIYNALYTPDSTLLLSTNNGLLYFSKPLDDDKPIANIYRVELASNNKRQYVKDGYIQSDQNAHDIFMPKYTYRSLIVNFSGLAGKNWNFGQNRLLFSSKLIGVDSEWQPWTTNNRREISRLSPGEYTLSVRTKNAFSQVSEPINLKFTISPRFYESPLFIVLIIGLIGIVFFTFTRWRFYFHSKKRFKLEQLINRRTEELVKEQEKADTLITRVLSRETATELKEKGKVSSQKFEMATVLFSDIEGFTRITEETNPEILIDQLDKFFFHFDTVVEKYRIEKIKTIGDAYMCAGGIPKKNRTNPIEVVLAALEMMSYMRDLNTNNSSGKNIWELRIGIDTGQVIAGVIGRSKLSYDIWGTTVNIASRMESSGKAGEINISGNTFLLIRDYFNCIPRGAIPIKNRGDVEMFFVKGIKPKLAADTFSVSPNHDFKILIQLIRLGDLEEFVLEKLHDDLPSNLYYHDLKHTVDVYTQVELIGREEGVTPEEILLLRTAALFHDMGHIIDYDTHEEMSAKLAEEILPEYYYSDEQISTIVELIMSTKLPPEPKNLLQEIMCDADLDYLGRSDFLPVSNTLYKELQERGKVGTLQQWNTIQKEFISKHSYFTKTARGLRNVNKNSQLEKLEEWLKKN